MISPRRLTTPGADDVEKAKLLADKIIFLIEDRNKNTRGYNDMKPLILFGSGADSDFCEKLKSGNSFSKSLLTDEFKTESEKLIGEKFKDYKLIHPNSTKVFLQTVHLNEKKAREVLEDADVNKCIEYVNNHAKNYDEIRMICKKWYDDIFYTNEDNQVKSFFLENAVLFDALDEKFNALRYTDFNDNARRVINAYAQVFILMMKSVYCLDDSFSWKYESVFKKLNEPYNIDSNIESYYGILGNSKLKTKIVTSNYTNLAEIYANKETIYLHGKLTWFEDLKNLTVFDCTKEEELRPYDAHNIIPYILIPSGVKPLICTKQIEEFSKFINELNDSNMLFCVGYKFNSEDNHINSIIAEWLRREKSKLTFLNFDESIELEQLKWAADFPKKTIRECDNISLDEKINNIIVNKNNSRDMFARVLEHLKKDSCQA